MPPGGVGPVAIGRLDPVSAVSPVFFLPEWRFGFQPVHGPVHDSDGGPTMRPGDSDQNDRLAHADPAMAMNDQNAIDPRRGTQSPQLLGDNAAREAWINIQLQSQDRGVSRTRPAAPDKTGHGSRVGMRHAEGPEFRLGIKGLISKDEGHRHPPL